MISKVISIFYLTGVSLHFTMWKIFFLPFLIVLLSTFFSEAQDKSTASSDEQNFSEIQKRQSLDNKIYDGDITWENERAIFVET